VTTSGESLQMTLPWEPEVVRERVQALLPRVPVDDPDRLFDVLHEAIQATVASFDSAASLYAGANVLSERSERLASVALGSRPTLGSPGVKFPTGVEGLDVIEVAATEAVRAVMGSKFAEVRLPTATLANLAVFTMLTEPCDTIASLPESAGGHVSHHTGAPRVRGLRVVDLPYDYESFDVDLDALPAFLQREFPRLVIIGGSLMLRPHNVAAIATITAEHGVPLLYDGSHVAGLIAGGTFQAPLTEGADLFTFSTYKSFGGPAGGVICTNNVNLAEQVSATVYPVLTANYDVSRLGPLAMAASELLADGGQYALACIENARTVGRVLAEEGMDVLGESFGFTESHHVAVDVRSHGDGDFVSKKLAQAKIFLSPTVLPLSSDEAAPSGLRIGTQELTRRGLSPSGFERLARLVAAVIRDDIPPESAVGEVADLFA
jgi:glycine hydroxymethyltransferase